MKYYVESRAPGQPIGLYAEPTDTSIIIRWTPPSDFNTTVVRKYVLKYGIGFPITEVEISGARNSFIINNLCMVFLKIKKLLSKVRFVTNLSFITTLTANIRQRD